MSAQISIKQVKVLVIAFFVLLINSSYLAAYAEPTAFYFSNVALHLLLGVVLGAAFGVFLVRRLRDLSGTLLISSVVIGLGAAFGVYLMIVGATRPHRWALYVHIALSVAGSIPLLFVIIKAAARNYAQSKGRSLVYATTVFLAVVVPMASGAYTWHNGVSRNKIVNPNDVPLAMEGEGAGPSSPFFPSSGETNVGGIIPSKFFMTAKDCARCHKEIYDQWNSSAHHFASFNNQWYRKSIEYMQDVVGTKPSKWCAGCHDHAVFFNGRFDRPIKEQIDTPEAQNGLGCTSCHSIVHVKSTMGQADFTIEYPPMHDLAVSDNPSLRWVHDYLLKVDPEPHRKVFLKEFHTSQTPEFCSTCHKVHLDVPVNDYRWFRGFNDYDNWQASGVSGEGARSFYYPPKSQKCADCHMPLIAAVDPASRDGKVHSHRFPAANTALPYVNQDAEQLKVTQDFLRDGQVTVDIFGLVRTGEMPAPQKKVGASEEQRLASTFAVGEESMDFGAQQPFISQPVEVIAPLGRVDAAVRRGDSVRVEVVVRTRKVGHFFPGGTVDAFDVWVELEAVDDKGQTIFHSGEVRDGGSGPVETGAHFYRSLQLDDHGNPISRRNAWMTRSVAYVRLVPPGAADTIHYRLNIPGDCGDKIFLKAKVNYRKFAWWNTQWAFAGVRDPEQKEFSLDHGHDDGRWVFTGDTSGVSGKIKAIPDIPITVMSYQETTLNVLPAKAPLPDTKPFLDKSVRERWNDYGIGLLLQGDIKGAEAAFLKVTEMDPEYADGWVNVGRARVQEGNMEAAEQILSKALEVNPNLAKSHFFLAMAIKAMGRYDEALEHLRVAASQYPRDRVVVNQIGRVLFLKRQYKEAIDEFKKVLKIDPEDLQAHYNLMLCYQGLGNAEMAANEQVLYKRFKADESAQAITGPYRQLHPDDNNERQQIHEHKSVALTNRPSGNEYQLPKQKRAGRIPGYASLPACASPTKGQGYSKGRRAEVRTLEAMRTQGNRLNQSDKGAR